MKKILILFVFLGMLPSVCLADFSPADWRYYKAVEGENSGWVNVVIDEDIFAGAREDLRDLRVIDDNNREVPHKLLRSRDKSGEEFFGPRMINNSYLPGKNSTVILDFGPNPPAVNRLTIDTPTHNFQRNVTLYGSDSNGGPWSVLLANAYIYDYTDVRGGLAASDTTIDFPDSIFRYLKIEIADDNNSPVAIGAVRGKKYTEEKVREITRDPNWRIEEAGQGDITEIYIDMGSSGIPTNRIMLAADNENFNRSASVYASANDADWKLLGQGYIFDYRTQKFTGRNLDVNFGETSDRYLKVVIFNKDDEPLGIKSVRTVSVYREIVFSADAGRRYNIYYGNAKARWPEYDLEKYFQYLDLSGLKAVTLSAQKENAAFVPAKEPVKPLTERLPYLMPAALILISGILLLLVYKFFQKK